MSERSVRYTEPDGSFSERTLIARPGELVTLYIAVTLSVTEIIEAPHLARTKMNIEATKKAMDAFSRLQVMR